MQSRSSLFILILASTAVFTAGCTQGTAPALPPTPLPVTAPHLQDLALSTTDVPACFKMTGQRAKDPSEVGTLAKDLGWQAGYVVRFTCPSDGVEPNVITHSLAVYPSENLSGIAFMVNEQDRLEGFTYENLSFPNQGSALYGFFGKTGGTYSSGIFPGISMDTGRDEVTKKDNETGSGEGEIIFYRGTIFEVIRMTGPGTNVSILRDLTGKASAKIP
jgi:hypothetical protein